MLPSRFPHCALFSDAVVVSGFADTLTVSVILDLLIFFRALDFIHGASCDCLVRWAVDMTSFLSFDNHQSIELQAECRPARCILRKFTTGPVQIKRLLNLLRIEDVKKTQRAPSDKLIKCPNQV